MCPASNLDGGNKICAGSHINNASVGRNTYIAGAQISNASLGAFCSIGPGVVIGGLGVHPVHWLSTHPAFYSVRGQSGVTFAKENLFEELKQVTIGNDVWIGARALVLDGVLIGDGAVVAAGAIVASDVAPYSIVGGVPAKVIRHRFSPDVIEALLKLRWWDLEDEQLGGLAPSFVRDGGWTVDHIAAIQANCSR